MAGLRGPERHATQHQRRVPEALAAGKGEVLMLQNDGVIQTLTFFGRDADGDGYGASSDAFPSDADQWSDADGTDTATIQVFQQR